MRKSGIITEKKPNETNLPPTPGCLMGVWNERSVLIKSVFTTKGNRSKSEMNTNNTSLSAILWNPIYKPMDAN